jgi:hypothetical protein
MRLQTGANPSRRNGTRPALPSRQQGLATLDARIREQWLNAVRTDLSERDTVFATLPIAKLLDMEGVLTVLRGEGFTVKATE